MLAAFSLASAVYAQVVPAQTSSSPVLSTSPQARQTTLGAGDQLLISVADLDEVKDRTVRIAEDGTVDLPLIGSVRASGISLPALRSELAAKFAKYVVNPQVSDLR